MKYGLLEESIEETAYLLGDNKVPYIFFNESGDWEPYLPKYECQADDFETNGCSVWATQNTIETFHRFLYNSEPNYSERFTYLLTPVDPERGVDPQKVFDCIRKYGLVDNVIFPNPHTKEAFLDEDDITGSLLAQGQRWLGNYDLQDEELWKKRPDNALELMKDALKTSPLAVTVTAWYRNSEGKYEDREMRNNHFCMVYRIDDEGIHVFDSYDLTKKVLTHDHYIKHAYRIFLNKKTISGLTKQRNLLQIILNKLMGKKTLVEWINESKAIGRDVTPLNEYKNEVSCAWSLSTLEHEVDPSFEKIPGTWVLNNYYANNPKFQEVYEPEPDVRIICATTPGHPFPGHCGVFMEDMTIASNDSRTGKFIKNYDYNTWRKRWVDKGGYTIHLYKKIS